MPEISKLEEVPSYVAGTVHLRGKIVPVVDMHLRFGYPPLAYGLEDCIIFLDRQGKSIGIIANEAATVHNFDQSAFAPMSSYGFEIGQAVTLPDPQYICGVATWGSKIVMRLQVDNVLDLSQSLADRYGSGTGPHSDTSQFPSNTPSESTAVFRDRALKLAQEVDRDRSGGSAPLVVVRIGEEFFGFALEVIREFADFRNCTPIPCCPDHVVGQMNLRGDLITIADIGKPLGIPPIEKRSNSKVVVLNDAALAVGVVVDELLGVIYPTMVDISSTHRVDFQSGQEYHLGSTIDGQRTLSLIDLPNLLKQGSLIVNEKLL